jgi:eukaryotic-like serine/threonine-protein kinase
LSGIFISYRRSDSPDATGRIYDRLVSEFGKAQVFKDVDSIPLGQDFRGHLNTIVTECGVMLAIIGPRWSDASSKAGQRRLEDPDDFVRIELEAALARDIPVVPVLVGHALMPVASELPGSLALMAFRQSIEVRPDPDFHNDATRLVTSLRGILDPAAAARAEQATTAISPSAAATGTHRGRLGWIVASVALLGMALLAIPAFHHLRETPPPEMRLDIATSATDQPDSYALSPDGRQIVFVASGDGASRVWLRALASTTAQPLAGTEGATYPFWSPDSRSIGFFAGGAIKRLDLGGGTPQTLAPAPTGTGGTWNAAGVILFAPNLGSGPLMRVSAAGGAAVPVTTITANQDGHIAPFFLPDGHRFLFGALGATDTRGIYLGDLTGGAPTRLTNAGGVAGYLPSGWMVWARDGTLVAQRLDVAKAALTGAPVTLASGVVAGMGISASVSATGLVAYRLAGRSHTQLTWFDRSGAAQGTIGQRDMWMPRVSPDGRRVVYVRGTESPSRIWLLDGSRTSPLTSGTNANWSGMWSPDGTRIVFESSRSTDQRELYEKLVNGAVGDERLLLDLGQVKGSERPTSWSPDGRFLLYDSFGPGPGTDLWVLPMTGPPKPFAFLQSSFRKSSAVFSPDGRWVAYESNESGQNEIYVRPFRPPGEKDPDAASASVQWQVSSSGGVAATWRPDGREIFYLDPSGAMMAAPITVSRATLAAGTPVKLFQTRIFGGGEQSLGRNYDVAPDGRFLIETLDTALNSAAAPITLIQNWTPDTTK